MKTIRIMVIAGIICLSIVSSIGCASPTPSTSTDTEQSNLAAAQPEGTSPAALPEPATPAAAPSPTTAAAKEPVVYNGAFTLSFLSFQPTRVSVSRNNTANLTINAIYAGKGTATGKFQDVTKLASFQSSNPKIAAVSSGGLITGVAAGSATINATYTEGGIVQTIAIPVTVTN